MDEFMKKYIEQDHIIACTVYAPSQAFRKAWYVICPVCQLQEIMFFRTMCIDCENLVKKEALKNFKPDADFLAKRKKKDEADLWACFYPDLPTSQAKDKALNELDDLLKLKT